MKTTKFLFAIGIVIIISMFFTACRKAPATSPAENPVNTQPTGGGTSPTQVVATKAAPSVPADVPIMDGAYDMQVPNELNITYKVKVQIKDVVAFYVAALPESGWDQMNNPDSVVGSMAQMARSKTNGDRITFSLQYNPVGEFSIVQIFLTRSGTPSP
jgi:hypothetical protein